MMTDATLQANARAVAELWPDEMQGSTYVPIQPFGFRCRLCFFEDFDATVIEECKYHLKDCPGYTPIIDLETLLTVADKHELQYVLTATGDECGHFLPYCVFKNKEKGIRVEAWADTPLKAAYAAAAQLKEKA